MLKKTRHEIPLLKRKGHCFRFIREGFPGENKLTLLALIRTHVQERSGCAQLKIKGLLAPASPEALCCVLEEDFYPLLRTGSTKEMSMAEKLLTGI